MGLIFPKAIVDEVRRAAGANEPAHRQDRIHFPGEFVGTAHLIPSPGAQEVGGMEVPVWCSCCGERLPAGEPVIEFGYALYPDTPEGLPGSETLVSYLHPIRCGHVDFKP